MTPLGYVIVYGPFVLVIGMLILSLFCTTSLGELLRSFSGLVVVVWVLVAIWALWMMNTDT